MDNEIKELEDRAFNLHSQATATTHIKTKESLMAEEAAINLKIEHLRTLQNEENEKQYSEKLQTLITENRNLIFFSVNGERIEIDKKGKVEIRFTPCGHTKTMQIARLQLHHHENNRIKFETWVRLLKTNTVYSGGLSCQECRENKKKRFQTLRRYTHKSIPKLSWELRALR